MKNQETKIASRTAHTPGPWAATGHDGKQSIVIETRWGDAAKALPIGCILQERANARLIAAAPDLLAALEGLLADPYLGAELNADRMAPARAAIAKAKGETAP